MPSWKVRVSNLFSCELCVSFDLSVIWLLCSTFILPLSATVLTYDTFTSLFHLHKLYNSTRILRESIEDATTMLPRIWLTRAKDGDVWKPLRKIDCKALNESRGMYNIICCNNVKICTCIII